MACSALARSGFPTVNPTDLVMKEPNLHVNLSTFLVFR